jgi:hypothetical protein
MDDTLPWCTRAAASAGKASKALDGASQKGGRKRTGNMDYFILCQYLFVLASRIYMRASCFALKAYT